MPSPALASTREHVACKVQVYLLAAGLPVLDIYRMAGIPALNSRLKFNYHRRSCRI